MIYLVMATQFIGVPELVKALHSSEVDEFLNGTSTFYPENNLHRSKMEDYVEQACKDAKDSVHYIVTENELLLLLFRVMVKEGELSHENFSFVFIAPEKKFISAYFVDFEGRWTVPNRGMPVTSYHFEWVRRLI